MRRFNLSHWAVTHQALVMFFIIALTAVGFYSYNKLGRAEDPSFTIKVAVITVAWPGATAQEMQNQVTERIEKKLQELPYFDKLQTFTKPSFSAMQLIWKDTTPPAMVPTLFYQMRKKIDDIRGDLPAGLIGPNINDEYGDVDSVLYTLSAEGNDFAHLKRIAEDFRKQLLKVPNVTKVNLYGAQDEKIFVEFSHAKLATLGIPAQAIFDSLAKQNAVAAAGVIETTSQRVAVRLTGAFKNEKDVAATPVEAGGRVFRLEDIATISRGYKDPAEYYIRQKGKAALAVGVVMLKGGNVLTLGADLKKASDAFAAELPVGIEFEQIADQPKVVEQSVTEFTRSFLEALIIVLAVSFLSLGWRVGIVVAMSVPLVLTIVFLIMFIMGIDLHRISLGALIIALGLLVDDAIIAVEMMVVKMEQGWDRMRAASYAWDSTAFPMLTGTLMTMVGFLPVGFAASSTGEYAGGIFWVVAIALLASWVVAVIFTPYLGVKLLPDYTKLHAKHNEDDLYNTGMYRKLRALIAWCVDHRYSVIVGTVGVFSFAIVMFGHVQQQFFPLSERPELFFQMRLPEGTSHGATLETVKRAEAMVAQTDDAATYTSYVGQGSPRFWLGLNPQLPNEAFGEIVVVAKDVASRERLKARLDKQVAEGALSEARVRVDRFNFGPPVGFPVQFRVVGEDPAKVRTIAYQVRDIMRQNKDVIDPHLDWNEQTPSLRLVLDQERTRALGLNPQEVAQTLQTLLSGVPVTTMRDGTEKVDVVARAVKSERLDLAHVGELTITTKGGVPVALSQVARIEYGHEEPILWRRNRDMAITVRGDIVAGVQAPAVSMVVSPMLDPVRKALPDGYRIEIGGAIEESAKANESLFAVFPVMLAIMLTILMIQLQDFTKVALVLISAPLGMIGASLALNVAGAPFGFVALLGLIALSGMDMRNSIILVDQVQQDIDRGMTHRNAIIESVVRRARPVVLTAMAAILGMIPLTRSAFWGPMALTVMGGLFVATFLTLMFLPALYSTWFGKKLRQEERDAKAKAQALQSNTLATAVE